MVLFEYKTLFSFFVKDGREGQVMFRKKQKLYICKKRKIRNGYTHQGVLQGRLKLTCGTPFLLYRKLRFLEVSKETRVCQTYVGQTLAGE